MNEKQNEVKIKERINEWIKKRMKERRNRRMKVWEWKNERKKK